MKMKYTIQKMTRTLLFLETNTILNGYSFTDEFGKCFIIVYGEGKRDSMKKYLEDPSDKLHIKYQYVDLPSRIKKCPVCDGHGELSRPPYDDSGICPECDGKGHMPT